MYGLNCKFEHKCAICGKWGHGAYNCRKASGADRQYWSTNKETGERYQERRDRYDDCRDNRDEKRSSGGGKSSSYQHSKRN